MKYIIFQCKPFEFAVEFPDLVQHSQITIGPDWRGVECVPVAAGFVNEDGGCYGHSTSLDLPSRGATDEAIISRQRRMGL